MNKKENSWIALTAVGITIGSLALVSVGMLYGGFVTMKLWNGIISPTFRLIQLNFFQALGLDVFVSYLVSGCKDTNKNEDNSLVSTFIKAIVITTVFWIVGMITMIFI